jgi:hypothetical protein
VDAGVFSGDAIDDAACAIGRIVVQEKNIGAKVQFANPLE